MVEVVEATPDELSEALDTACREQLGMTGEEFMALVRQDDTPDHPAAVRLVVLAEALIERE